MKRPVHARHAARSTVAGVLALLLAALWLPALAQEPSPRLAIVDMQRLLDEAPQMATARQRLTREFAPRDAELSRQREQLAQMERRLSEQGEAMPRQEAEALAREIGVLRRAAERARERLRDALATRNREERDRVWLQLNDAVAQYARDAGIDLVLPTPVLYASARIDITDRVLDRLRRQAGEAGE